MLRRLPRFALVVLLCHSALHCDTPDRLPDALPAEQAVESSVAPADAVVKPGEHQPQETAEHWEPFAEYVSLDFGERPRAASFRSFVESHLLATVRSSDGKKYFLVDVETLETKPLSFSEESDFLSLHTRYGHPFAVAVFRGPDSSLRLEIFRGASQKWEAAGSVKRPAFEQPIDPDERRSGSSDGYSVYLTDDSVRLWVWNGMALEGHALEVETMMWSGFDPRVEERNACGTPCRGAEDLVRWGGDHIARRQQCVAVRASADSEWKRVDLEKTSLDRRCRRLGDDRVVVVNGYTVGFPPEFDVDFDILNLETGEHRTLKKVGIVGRAVDVPGDELVWMVPSRISRFDPGTETLTVQDGPRPDMDLDLQTEARLGPRTWLIAERRPDPIELKEDPSLSQRRQRFVRYGFRKVTDQ